MKDLYNDYKIVELIKLCKMGDIVAMTDLAERFKKRCARPVRKALDAYASNPTEENKEIIKKQFFNNQDSIGAARAYMMWICRSAIYGNKKAETMLDKLPYFKEKSSIMYDLMANGTQWESIWSSDYLYNIGWIDMRRELEDCCLIFHKDEGYYDFCYVSSYCPADDDGFGEEFDYSSLYFDEFFKPIPRGKALAEGLKELEEERERYWNAPGRDITRKYKNIHK